MRRLPFAVAVLFSLFSFFTPDPDLPSVTEDIWDKAGHASIFAALALTGVLAAIAWRHLATGLFGYAVLTEVLQAVLPIHRSGDWHDVVADSVGIIAGLLLAGLVGSPLRRRAAGPHAGR
ncbi:MAG TPA: VanZ family protein [Marmoricola sp.]